MVGLLVALLKMALTVTSPCTLVRVQLVALQLLPRPVLSVSVRLVNS